MMYGIATDDSHNYHRQGREWSNAGRGWIMVKADSLNPAALIGAMENGTFYASTGVTLAEVGVEEGSLKVKVDGEDGVEYEIVFIGARKGENAPVTFETTDGTEGSFKITEDVLFVRCKVISTKPHNNPIENLNYEMAWTQPVVRE
jgi:hypothetical protein